MRRLGDLVWERDGTVVSAQARVGDVRVEPGFRGRTQRTIARLEDDTGSIDATWFGRRFIERRLAVGAEIVVSGKVKHFGRRLTLDNPEFQVVADDTELLHAGRIVPVYPLTAGLTSIRLRAAIREALDRAGYAYPEYLPAGHRRRGAARAHRPGDRGGPLPGLLRGPGRGPSTARLRRALCTPARDGPAAPPADPRRGAAGRARCRRGRVRPVGDRLVSGRPGRPARRTDRGPGRHDDGDPRRPGPPDADASAAPGRRRVGQDRGRGVRPRGHRPGRPPGSAARADRPPRPAAPRDRRVRCSTASASGSRCSPGRSGRT